MPNANKKHKIRVGEIKWLARNTMLTNQQIASIYNMGKMTVSRIASGAQYKDIDPISVSSARVAKMVIYQ